MNLSNFLFALQSEFPTLDLQLRAEWGAQTPDHRKEIRKALAQVSGEFAVEDLAILPPSHASVSHCPSLGGFVFNRSLAPVGLDIEETARVNLKVIARVSTEEELAQAQGHEAHLWAAKEAAWKAVGSAKTISDIHILNWQRLSPHLYKYKVSGFNGSGIVGTIENWQIAVYLLPSSRSE